VAEVQERARTWSFFHGRAIEIGSRSSERRFAQNTDESLGKGCERMRVRVFMV
jgi:hypothetical protein